MEEVGPSGLFFACSLALQINILLLFFRCLEKDVGSLTDLLSPDSYCACNLYVFYLFIVFISNWPALVSWW